MKLATFLNSNRIKKNDADAVITHTRMGDNSHNIIPGSFSIGNENVEKFQSLLYNDVVVKKGKEYLTETQLKENGGVDRCIAIDFDFNYERNTARCHTYDDVSNIVGCILDKLKTMFDFASNPECFYVYVLQRSDAYQCERKKCTKDGIHIIFGIKANTIQQSMLREDIIEELPIILSDLPLINKFTDVYDNSVTSASSNWQVYGCRKPGQEPYLLSYYYRVEWQDNDFMCDFMDAETFPMKEKINCLSVRNTNFPVYDLTEDFERKYQERINKNPSNDNAPRSPKFNLNIRNVDLRMDKVQPENIKSKQDLEKILNVWYDALGDETDIRYGKIRCKLKEVHDMTMILPDDFSDDYEKWIKIGWALFNTSNSDYMFYTWMLFSSRSSKFDYGDIPQYYGEKYWGGFVSGRKKECTAGSIVYWAREYWNTISDDINDNKYMQIKQNTIDAFVDQTFQTSLASSLQGNEQATDFDIAKVLYHYCRERFVCADIKNSQWYEFKNHKFKLIDSGVSLSLIISSDLHDLYYKRMLDVAKSIQRLDKEDDPRWKDTKTKIRTLSNITSRVKDTDKKGKIMRAAKELFYDAHFYEKIDNNSKVIGCNNGVVDFEQNVFREGDTLDYITKTTKRDYIPSHKLSLKIKEEINDFMKTLFPIPDLCKYMWQMLASCLVGNNRDQSFHIFTGAGSNGKSLLMKLMKYVLGEYYGIVPESIVTDKRPKIGGLSPEIMNLKGTRLAVINEPSKGTRLNEGPMKALTGGDDITARGLFKDAVTFTPSFKLAVCTNVLFEIDATDEGTWRRIKVIPFMSHFTDKPDPEKEYEFKKDIDLEDKMLKNWVEPFLSMLVDVAFETGGSIQTSCSLIDAKSNEYRNNQDHIMNFIHEKIKETPGEKIKKGELQREFEDWFRIQYGKRNAPKMKEIYPAMDKKFGKYHNNGWHNVTIINDDDDDAEEDKMSW